MREKISVLLIVILLYLLINYLLHGLHPYPEYLRTLDSYNEVEKIINKIEDVVIPDYDIISGYTDCATYNLLLDDKEFLSNVIGYGIDFYLPDFDKNVSVEISATKLGTKFAIYKYKDAALLQANDYDEIVRTTRYFMVREFYLNNYNYHICVYCDSDLIYSNPEWKKIFIDIISEISDSILLRDNYN